MSVVTAPRETAVDAERPLILTVGAATDVGGRTENEDAYVVNDLPAIGDGPAAREAGKLIAVADGMGGHQRGEVAAQLAVDTVTSVMLNDTSNDTALALKRAFREANQRIYHEGGGEAGQTMGTTLVAAVLRGKYATIASVGDSRAYLIRANRLNQITQDHSLVAEQVAKGTMTRDQARQSPQRNVLTHALGQRERLETKLPSIFEFVLLDEDRLLLCTDGFYDVVGDDEIVATATQSPPDAAATRLVELAKERGTSDNVTAVVVAVNREPAPTTITPTTAEEGGVNVTLLVSLLVVGLALLVLVVLFLTVF